jgi:hypothetical protein
LNNLVEILEVGVVIKLKEKEYDHEEDHLSKKLFGLDPDMSLQTVNFATSENKYLNEHAQEDLE